MKGIAISDDAGQRLAVQAEALYLANLLLLPGIAFGVLFWIYLRRYSAAPPLARCHLAQTVRGTMWGAILLIWVTTLIIAAGGPESPTAWTVAALHFIVVHTAFVMLGVIGLSYALVGKPFRYPLVGVNCHE